MGARSPLLRPSVLGDPLHRGALRAPAAVLMLLSLVACSPISSPPVQSQFPDSETDGNLPTDNAGDGASSPDSSAETVAVELLGDDLVVLESAATSVTADGDGGVHLRTTLAEPGAVRYTFDAPAGTVVTVAPDRSAAVVGAEGELRAGLAAPIITTADGTELRTRWTVAEPEDQTAPLALDLDTAPGARDRESMDEDATVYPLTVEVHLGQDVVSSVEWGDREGGRSLAVTPTSWGRESGLTGRDYGWADVVRLEPSADTDVMRNQFLCHVDGARQKDTWNLEPWRPDISFFGYLLARCNPT